MRLTHDLQNRQPEAPWIESTTLLCPALDLEATLKSHIRNPVKRKIVNSWAESRLHLLKPRLDFNGSELFLGSLIEKVVKEYQGPSALEPWVQVPPQVDVKDFWASHEFLAELDGDSTSQSGVGQNSKVPLTLIATNEDPIVPLSLNSGRFQETQVLDRGIHCGLSSVYDWNRLSTYLEGALFLNRSKPWGRKSVVFELPRDLVAQIKTHGFHPQFEVKIPRNSNWAEISVRFLPQAIASSGGLGNWLKLKWESLWAPEETFRISLAQFDFLRSGEIKSQAEQDMYHRWITHRLVPEVVENGQKLQFSWIAGGK